MELGLAGKVALVTGASRGLGEAISIELANQGMRVCLLGRDEKRLQNVARAISEAGGQCAYLAADVADPGTADAAVVFTREKFGRLDLLVNSAGTTKRGDFFKLSDADWNDGFAVKFFGALRLSRAAWPLLRDSRGTIINIIGIGGYAAAGDGAIPGTVNAAFMNLTKALAQIGVRDGIRVNAINPGRIETDRLKINSERLAREGGISAEEALERLRKACGIARFGKPKEIAAVVAFLASANADFFQGSLVDVDGGELQSI